MAQATGDRKVNRGSTVRFNHVFTRENPGKIDDFYTMDRKKQLGEGSYGQVTHGVNKATGASRAVKSIDLSKIPNSQRFEDEVNIQCSLDHPHIVKLYETFKDAKRIYLVMELCTGGELFDRIVDLAESHADGHAFDENGAATYMGQILGAMQYLHTNEFVHRDIKPENFLLANKNLDAPIKVIDFGLARKFKSGDPLMKTKAGTPYYVAPQVLGGAYTEKCDVWSCGVIAYILLCGYPPFYGDLDEDILRRVKAGKFNFPSPDWDTISTAAKEFIKISLTFEEAKRPSAADLLAHEWLTKKISQPSGGYVGKDLGAKLKVFRGVSKLKKAALTLIAQQLKDDDIEELKKTFTLLDANKDGTLSAKEIADGMAKHKVQIPADLDEVIRQLDTDGSGNIDYTEFVAATITQKQYSKKEVLWAAFRTFDLDGDGSITKSELSQVLKNASETLVESMVVEHDTDGDGTISFEEFVKMMSI